MKTWTKTININAPIENVWKLLDGSLADMQKIMPQVIENKHVKVTEEGVGSIYRQKYKEGKRIETYDVETLEYSNTPDKKIMKVGFVLANLFEITAYYELNKINETETSFTYSVTNNALKWFVKLFLLFASDKVVVQFLERVKTVAEAQD
ncbi:SRPBCC family protein [Lysinibacillus capsici]|uniref:SRPBCC family protein n=1 Tax=Lysinibacillus capsici TaxID=2115968 RepID=UPI002E1D545F|nr:SRPBCC family protein [Lysinibacillus capsici]